MRSERRDHAEKNLSVRASDPEKLVKRDFPGPRMTGAKLRVAMERAAYAELIAHAKQSLEAEVCGVLVGQQCEDHDGRFVHVEAIIRGTAASHGATHVTFTQATWDAIHATLEREHPRSRIVGWYHTHPGFGVEFSEMDVFIQKNFFAGAGQIALVMDPMSGAVAIAANGLEGIEYLPRFWVDAREQMGKVPGLVSPQPTPGKAASSSAPPDLALALQALESRVSQLVEANDQQRASFHRFLYTLGFMVCLALVTGVGYVVYSHYTARFEPPHINNYVPIPIQIGDKRVLVGVGVVDWDVPPELNALIQRAEDKDADASATQKSGARPVSGAAGKNHPGTPVPNSVPPPASAP